MSIQKNTIPPLPPELHDFRAFLWLVWKFLGLPEPTPVQYDIAHFLQYGPKRKLIKGFRGVGKSWITSAYVAWRLRMNPQLNFLVVSASKSRSDDFSTFTLRLIKEMPILQCLIPRPDQRESKIAFDVAPAMADHAPSVKSVGIFGQLTGTRADEIIADDVEVPNNTQTQQAREKLGETVKEFESILKPGGSITYLGTPQSIESLYNLLPDRGYTSRVWTARYPDEKSISEFYGEQLSPMLLELVEKDPSLVGKTTDPKRFSDDDLLEREISYGRSGFQLQFMLDTSLSDADKYPLKLSDLVIMSVPADKAPEKIIWASSPDLILQNLPCVGLNGDRYYRPMWIDKDHWASYTGSVMAIDPSGKGSDETGYAIVKMLHGYLFVPEAGGIKGGYEPETLTKLAEIAKRNNVNQIIIEENFGGGMFSELLTPYLKKIHPCAVENKRHSKQKELRIIDTLEPVMNQHRLIVDPKVIEKDIETSKVYGIEHQLKYQLMYQLSHITKDRGSLSHDDRADVLAMAVAYWEDQMAQDAAEQSKKRREEELQEEFAVFKGRKRQGFLGLVTGHNVNKNLMTRRWI